MFFCSLEPKPPVITKTKDTKTGDKTTPDDKDSEDDDKIETEVTNHNPSANISTDVGTNVTTAKGSSVSFNCTVDGIPRPDVMWLKNGEVLEVDKDDRLSVQEKEKTSVLTILKSQASDSGDYTCNATNVFGTTNKTSKLSVYGKLNDFRTTFISELLEIYL